jgi:large subunit ribosomal protein L1
MGSSGKNFEQASNKVDRDALYELDAAVALVKETSYTAFDESVDLAVRLE